MSENKETIEVEATDVTEESRKSSKKQKVVIGVAALVAVLLVVAFVFVGIMMLNGKSEGNDAENRIAAAIEEAQQVAEADVAEAKRLADEKAAAAIEEAQQVAEADVAEAKRLADEKAAEAVKLAEEQKAELAEAKRLADEQTAAMAQLAQERENTLAQLSQAQQIAETAAREAKEVKALFESMSRNTTPESGGQTTASVPPREMTESEAGAALGFGAVGSGYKEVGRYSDANPPRGAVRVLNLVKGEYPGIGTVYLPNKDDINRAIQTDEPGAQIPLEAFTFEGSALDFLKSVNYNLKAVVIPRKTTAGTYNVVFQVTS